MRSDDLIRIAAFRAGVVKVRNALNPILWVCAVASPLCFSFAYMFSADPVLRYGLATLGALPIIFALAAYLYFMLRNPDRLQSEEFVLRQQELAIIERKRKPPISMDAESEEDTSVVIKRQAAVDEEP